MISSEQADKIIFNGLYTGALSPVADNESFTVYLYKIL